MKLNISCPSTGLQKTVLVEEEAKILPFLEKRMAAEIDGSFLGDEYAGYVFRISGGNDKQGFPMKQGVMSNGRVRLLFKDGMNCFRERRAGSRKRKTVRGCIVGSDISVLNLVIVKQGKEHLPGITDDTKPRRLGPKKASSIRKLFQLAKDDDVRKFVIRRQVNDKTWKAPKIQRLITPERIHRKRHMQNRIKKHMEKSVEEEKKYKVKLAAYRLAQKEKRAAEVSKKKADKKKASDKKA